MSADTGEPPRALVDWLRRTFGDDGLAVESYRKLAGGAIQQNIALDLVHADGRCESLVLRTDAPSGVSVSRSRSEEHALLSAAFDAGVTVPEPLGLCTDLAVIGRPFFLMRRVSGTTHPVRLTRDEAFDDAARGSLVAALGAELAGIHAVPLDDARLAFLQGDVAVTDVAATTGSAVEGVAPTTTTTDPMTRTVAHYRRLLDELGTRRPVLEWTLSWLGRQRLREHGPTLCHNDFRTGNLMIDDASIAGVLDWEFAAIGDPHADIGWFCAPCWRFASRAREAGGLGSRDAFYRGYEQASGRTIDRKAVPVWEIVATLRWAVIALQQGARFTSGAERTLELGLTGRMIAELERDLLDQICAAEGVGCDGRAGVADPAASPAEDPGKSAPGYDRPDERTVPDEPSAAALLDAARETVLKELLPSLPAACRYDGLMVARAIGIASRELSDTGDAMRDDVQGGAPGDACAEPVTPDRGVTGDEATASISPPDPDDAMGRETIDRLRRDVSARLAIANPARASTYR